MRRARARAYRKASRQWRLSEAFDVVEGEKKATRFSRMAAAQFAFHQGTGRLGNRAEVFETD